MNPWSFPVVAYVWALQKAAFLEPAGASLMPSLCLLFTFPESMCLFLPEFYNNETDDSLFSEIS